MNHDEHFENLLDQALNKYRDAQPLTGLEARVLERLKTSQPARAVGWLRWGIAAACAAVVALVVWIGMARGSSPAVVPADRVAAQPKVVAPSQTPSIATQSPASTSGNKQFRSVSPQTLAIASVVPSQSKPATADVFPVPVPLNDNERAFAAALNRHPEVLRPAPAADIAPLIAQIEIKPLSTTDETPGESQ